MKNNSEVKVSLDLADMLMVAKKTEVKHELVTLESRVTRHVRLMLPFIALTQEGADQMAADITRMGGMALINYNMSVESQIKMVGTLKTAEVGAHESATLDASGKLVTAALVKAAPDAFDKASMLANAGLNIVFLEGHHLNVREVAATVEKIRRNLPGLEVVAGNAFDDDTVRTYIESGADGIKTGGRRQIIERLGLDMLNFQKITDIVADANVAQVPVVYDDDVRTVPEIAKYIGVGFETVMLREPLAMAAIENLALGLKAVIAYTGNSSLQSFIDNVEFSRKV